MKKISYIVNIILLIIVLFLIIHEKNPSIISLDHEQEELIYGIKDYPLLEIPIENNESEIALIIANDIMQSDEAKYLYTKNKETLKKMQAAFNVNSFPAGQDTTPDSIVTIYQDNILIKEVPFWGTYNNEDQFDLSYMNKQDMKKTLKLEEAYPVIDYPLVDIPIRYNESEVQLIIANNVMQSDEAEYLYTNDKKTLEEMQTVFHVITFPADRGTTPDSMVYVYEDNILIKEIPFFDTYSHEDQFALSHLNKTEAEEILRQEVPPAI